MEKLQEQLSDQLLNSQNIRNKLELEYLEKCESLHKQMDTKEKQLDYISKKITAEKLDIQKDRDALAKSIKHAEEKLKREHLNSTNALKDDYEKQILSFRGKLNKAESDLKREKDQNAASLKQIGENHELELKKAKDHGEANLASTVAQMNNEKRQIENEKNTLVKKYEEMLRKEAEKRDQILREVDKKVQDNTLFLEGFHKKDIEEYNSRIAILQNTISTNEKLYNEREKKLKIEMSKVLENDKKILVQNVHEQYRTEVSQKSEEITKKDAQIQELMTSLEEQKTLNLQISDMGQKESESYKEQILKLRKNATTYTKTHEDEKVKMDLEIKNLKITIGNLRKQIDDYRTLEDKMGKMQNTIDSDKKLHMEKESEIKKRDGIIKELQERNKKMFEEIITKNQKCDDMLQAEKSTITTEYTKKLENRNKIIKDLEKKIQNLTQNSTTLTYNYNKQFSLTKSRENQLEALGIQHKELQENMNDLKIKTEREYKTLKKQYDQLESEYKKTDKVREHSEKVSIKNNLELQNKIHEIKTLREKLEDREEKWEKTREKNISLLHTKEVLENTNSELDKKISEVMSESRKINAESEKIRDKFTKLESELKLVKPFKIKYETELPIIRNSNSELMEKIVTYEKSVGKNNTTVNKEKELRILCESENAKLKNTIDNNDKKHKNMIKNAEEERKKLIEANVKLTSQLDTYEKNYIKMEERLKSVTEELPALKTRVTNMTIEANKLRDENVRIEKERLKYEQMINRYKEQKDFVTINADAKVSDLKGKHIEEMREIRDKYDEEKSLNNELKNKATELTRLVNKHYVQIAELKSKNSQHEKDLEKMKMNKQRDEKQIRDLETYRKETGEVLKNNKTIEQISKEFLVKEKGLESTIKQLTEDNKLLGEKIEGLEPYKKNYEKNRKESELEKKEMIRQKRDHENKISNLEVENMDLRKKAKMYEVVSSNLQKMEGDMKQMIKDKSTFQSQARSRVVAEKENTQKMSTKVKEKEELIKELQKKNYDISKNYTLAQDRIKQFNMTAGEFQNTKEKEYKNQIKDREDALIELNTMLHVQGKDMEALKGRIGELEEENGQLKVEREFVRAQMKKHNIIL